MSTWIKDVTAFYHEQKKNNPNYKFKDALKELSKKRKGTSSTTKTAKKSRKSRKSRKSKKSRK